MRVLLDAGAFIHSEFAEPTVKEVSVRWGSGESAFEVHGLKRKQPEKRGEDYQEQKDAMFTIGRMIREQKINAFTSVEIEFEYLRGTSSIQEFNALKGCKVERCDSALNRSQFRKTSDFIKSLAKGGKKDRRLGASVGSETQIAFMEWLCALDKTRVDVLIARAPLMELSPFDVESLDNLGWFQFVCARSGSPENYPDVFHLWTAERHKMHAFLTLEKKLPNLVTRIRGEKKREIEISTEALRPLDLLQRLGISEPDPVPIERDHFYHLYEYEP
jgi:hypothetical protein